jgi:hypothetical protein
VVQSQRRGDLLPAAVHGQGPSHGFSSAAIDAGLGHAWAQAVPPDATDAVPTARMLPAPACILGRAVSPPREFATVRPPGATDSRPPNLWAAGKMMIVLPDSYPRAGAVTTKAIAAGIDRLHGCGPHKRSARCRYGHVASRRLRRRKQARLSTGIMLLRLARARRKTSDHRPRRACAYQNYERVPSLSGTEQWFLLGDNHDAKPD